MLLKNQLNKNNYKKTKLSFQKIPSNLANISSTSISENHPQSHSQCSYIQKFNSLCTKNLKKKSSISFLTTSSKNFTSKPNIINDVNHQEELTYNGKERPQKTITRINCYQNNQNIYKMYKIYSRIDKILQNRKKQVQNIVNSNDNNFPLKKSNPVQLQINRQISLQRPSKHNPQPLQNNFNKIQNKNKKIQIQKKIESKKQEQQMKINQQKKIQIKKKNEKEFNKLLDKETGLKINLVKCKNQILQEYNRNYKNIKFQQDKKIKYNTQYIKKNNIGSFQQNNSSKKKFKNQRQSIFSQRQKQNQHHIKEQEIIKLFQKQIYYDTQLIIGLQTLKFSSQWKLIEEQIMSKNIQIDINQQIYSILTQKQNCKLKKKMENVIIMKSYIEGYQFFNQQIRPVYKKWMFKYFQKQMNPNNLAIYLNNSLGTFYHQKYLTFLSKRMKT